MSEFNLTKRAVDDPAWLDLLGRCHDASIFHHPAWIGLLTECYGYQAFVLAFGEDSQRITAGLPVMAVRKLNGSERWISLPFTDYCPPLAEDDAMEEFAASLGRTARENRRPMMLRGSLSAGRNVECYSDAVRHTLPLGDDPDTLYKSFSKMHQRNIRKAGRAGVRILCSSVADAVNVFYGLHLLTRRRLGVPIQPQRFFRLLGERLLVPGLGFVLTAYLEDVPVASAVFLAWNGWLIYKYGASDARYWECRPNNLLFWEAIRWGLGHGCHTLDFGRTDLDDQGLRDFKMGWGGREEALVYSVIGEPAPKVSAFRLSHLMTPVIQRSPAWVCRLLGELFYKYAA